MLPFRFPWIWSPKPAALPPPPAPRRPGFTRVAVSPAQSWTRLSPVPVPVTATGVPPTHLTPELSEQYGGFTLTEGNAAPLLSAANIDQAPG